MCSALRHAEAEISERVLRLENGWLRFSHQLNFIQSIRRVIDEQHQEILQQTLHMFNSKLQAVNTLLDGLVKVSKTATGTAKNRPKKVKYAWKKDTLDKAIEDLEIWQRTADQSWYLLMRIADPSVDAALSRDNASTVTAVPSTLTIRHGMQPTDTGSGLSLPPDALYGMVMSPILFSKTMSVAQRHHSSGKPSTYILNSIHCPLSSKSQLVQKDTRDLARKLRHDEPETFGLLSCKGFITQRTGDSPQQEVKLTIVFRAPTNFGNSRSLRDLLTTINLPKFLSYRFDIARGLAKSVGYVHTFGFVHKNVRPESILSFAGTNTTASSTFLVGFENFRRDEGWTQKQGDDSLDRNLYRHASRQGTNPSEDYVMQHDIYSLGVCMLEVGFWKSFIEYTPEGKPRASPILGFPTCTNDFEALRYLQTEGKERLLSLARNELPQYMGSKYAEVVETCLTCLDPGNEDFGDEREFEDEDGIRVGVRYIEKVSVYYGACLTCLFTSCRFSFASTCLIFESVLGYIRRRNYLSKMERHW